MSDFIYENDLMRCPKCGWEQHIRYPFDAWTAALFHCFNCPKHLPVESRRSRFPMMTSQEVVALEPVKSQTQRPSPPQDDARCQVSEQQATSGRAEGSLRPTQPQCGCPCHQVIQPGLIPCPHCTEEAR